MQANATNHTERLRQARASERGAAAVLMVVVMLAVMGVAAVTIDVTRLMALRAELQTAVDAAALAGALELAAGGGDASRDTALSYASRNTAETDTVRVSPQSVEFGVWDPEAMTFTALPNAVGANAINVSTRKNVGTYFAWVMNFLDVSAAARATAWSASPIGATNCVKPWAIPEELLDDNNDGIVQEEEVELAILSQREFVLKGGTGGGTPDSMQSGIPSFFYPVVLPAFWDAGTGQYVDLSGEGGADEYRDAISDCDPNPIGVGDSLLVEPGNMPGPTVQGARNLCGEVVATYCNPSGMYSPDGEPGIPIIAAFWDSDVDPTGRASVEVSTLGAFRLIQVYSQGQHGVVVGRFERLIAQGEVGNQQTNLIRPILVR
jgi:Flp pilus assembly protein TadG